MKHVSLGSPHQNEKRSTSSTLEQGKPKTIGELLKKNKIKGIGTLFMQNNLLMRDLMEKKESECLNKESILIKSKNPVEMHPSVTRSQSKLLPTRSVSPPAQKRQAYQISPHRQAQTNRKDNCNKQLLR